MKASPCLNEYLNLTQHGELSDDQKTLVLICGQLGNFDSIEYAQACVEAFDQLRNAKIELILIAIGDSHGAEQFCSYTRFPRKNLYIVDNNQLHDSCGLYAGVDFGYDPWFHLFFMCAGLGSPGTLKEVFRGYTGDRHALQRIQNPLFELAGGKGFLRPFELATVRLQNMIEVLSHWGTYVPNRQWICQCGGTYLLDHERNILYEYKDKGILGFSATMDKPLSFLDQYLKDTLH